MKILMICQHYWPEHFQITEICEELVARGHEVTALVGIPNYPSGVIPERYLGHRNRVEVHEGVNIIRCDEVPRNSGIIGLAKNYFSYMISALKKVNSLPCFDVIFAYQITPVLMAAPAVRAKEHCNAPVLLYCADIWPDAIKAMLPKGLSFLFPFVKMISTKIYSSSDFIATNSKAYIDCFEQVHGLDRSILKYVPQYAEDSYLKMNLEAPHRKKINFMIMGNIGKLQDMSCVLNAVRLLRDRDDFELHIVGTGSALDECINFVKMNKLDQLVIFHGKHSFEEMPHFYRMTNACVLTLNVPKAPWISSTLPSRLQGYMAAGKPVLAAINGSAKEVIAESGCGRTVEAGDSAGLAHLLEDFIDNRSHYKECGANGRNYFKRNFNKARYMDEIESLLLKLTKDED
jgi:glycosyltransferase involved in cell wall biosynthesis